MYAYVCIVPPVFISSEEDNIFEMKFLTILTT